MSPSKSIEIGDIVAGKYRLLAMIGEGGMGVVYLAEHSLIEKRVALKVLRAEYSTKPELVSRFQQEAISASRIKHPNVLDVFDFGQLEDGSFFLAMEYLSGRDLAAELSESGTIAPERAVRIGLQMCRALAAAHSRGVVHRDLKPENVFLHLTEDGDEIVKIVDFGIAQLKGKDEKEEGIPRKRRLTRTGMIFGTPEYMSPEQSKGIAVDLRSDIYALGVILYEMVTGAVPFSGNTFMAVLTAHMTQPVPPLRAIAPDLQISSDLEQAILRSLAKEPENRFQSMRDLANVLQQAAEGRVAAPLGGLLQVPEVNIGSFRPARGAAAQTSPQFDRLDPLPFDLMGRDPKAQVSFGRDTSSTLITGSTDADLQADGARMAPVAAAKRWPQLAIFTIALLAAGASALLWRLYGERTKGYLAGHSPSSESRAIPGSVPANARKEVGTAGEPSATDASIAVAAGTQPNSEKSPTTTASGAPGPVSDVPKPITLTIQSNLPGATVSKDGFQICDQTPCSVEVARGSAVELVGVKGYARGVARVLAQQDQTVNLVLTHAKSGKKKDSGKPGLCEVTVDGLKILRPCQ